MPEAPSNQTDHARMIAEMAELAGGLAHELRNPLSTMMINLKLLAEDLHDAGASEGDVRRRALLKVEGLRREAERLQSLFDEFLNLTGPCRLVRAPVDVRLIVNRLVEFFEPFARSKGVHVHVRHGSGDQPIVCEVDENLLRQALLNLLMNAQQAMWVGGELRIETDREGGQVVIAVSDTGSGISESDLERIAKPFFSTKADGNGLGLSITHRIVHEHGGSLAFASEVGRGTTVTVRLPLENDAGKPPTAG